MSRPVPSLRPRRAITWAAVVMLAASLAVADATAAHAAVVCSVT